MKPTVLFVDDTENILQGLRRNLRTMRDEWDLHFAVNGMDALKLMRETHIDVIVSDIRMPGMDGAELLKLAKGLYGHTIRMVLSGQCDEDALMTLLEVSHQFMAKPLDTAVIVAAIKPVLAAKASLQDDGLAHFIAGIASLPSLPSLHESIVAALREDHPAAKDVENLLLRDISLVAKIFQVMNSSYFGANRDISTLAYVWELLGLERIRTLVLDGHIIAPLEKAFEKDPFIIGLWNMSLMTARIARLIAKAEGLPQKTCDKVWVAGLLHAIGAVILCKYGQKTDTPHPAAGHFLAVLWGLPRDIQHVILHHAAPGKAGGESDKTILAIVHAARALAHVKMKPVAAETEYLDADFLRQAGVAGKLKNWRTAAEEI